MSIAQGNQSAMTIRITSHGRKSPVYAMRRPVQTTRIAARPRHMAMPATWTCGAAAKAT